MDTGRNAAVGPRVSRARRVLIASAIAAYALVAGGCAGSGAAGAHESTEVVIAPVLASAARPPTLAPSASARDKPAAPSVRGIDAIVGTWKMHDSTARVRVEVEQGELRVSAWDSTDDDARFDVLESTWDGERLRITLRYVPNDWTTTCVLHVKSDGTLEGERSGDASGHLIWTRVGADAADEPEPPPP